MSGCVVPARISRGRNTLSGTVFIMCYVSSYIQSNMFAIEKLCAFNSVCSMFPGFHNGHYQKIFFFCGSGRGHGLQGDKT